MSKAGFLQAVPLIRNERSNPAGSGKKSDARQTFVIRILRPEQCVVFPSDAVHRSTSHSQIVLTGNFCGSNSSLIGQVQQTAQPHHVKAAVDQLFIKTAAQYLVHFKDGDDGNQKLVALFNHGFEDRSIGAGSKELYPARRINHIHQNARSGSFSGSISPNS